MFFKLFIYDEAFKLKKKIESKLLLFLFVWFLSCMFFH